MDYNRDFEEYWLRRLNIGSVGRPILLTSSTGDI